MQLLTVPQRLPKNQTPARYEPIQVVEVSICRGRDLSDVPKVQKPAQQKGEGENQADWD